MNLDDNPFMTVFDHVRSGTMTIDQGERAAAAPGVVGSLTLPFVGGLSEASFDAAGQGQWFQAQIVQRLLVAATEQLPNDAGVTDAYRMRQVAAGDWVEIAHIALSQMPSPDGRLLVAARVRGDQALQRAQRVGHPGEMGTLNFRLGTLHLDPYLTRPSPLTGPSRGQPPWQAALVPELGDTVLGVGREYWPMPDRVNALRYAAAYLRASFTGERRHASAAKALAQTLDAQLAIGDTVDRAELLAACQAALDALDPEANAPVFEEISEILARRS
jgi:hypothetical protein